MTPFEVLSEVQRRAAEAVIAQSGLAHEGLRQHLRNILGGDDIERGALLQKPILEGSHPFVTADVTMNALGGSSLHRDLVRALDDLPADHEYRFPSKRKPFLHQAEAWRVLAEPDPQSVLVTSGTGSGKTECFLFPILSDLVAQAQGVREPLEGVQAIMLYPLNALIESQRERLSAWTQPFGGVLRYCLYNGDLPRVEQEANRRRNPERVIDRESLRACPPPIIVTNITMLEYMLARAEDQPIIDSSHGKLKWIVLDEAHTLVGAAAAEIALLLRRVLLAFAAQPENVRFIATSATIGTGADVREQLQRFLADVAGIPDGRVHVIEGRRQMPSRPMTTPGRAAFDIRDVDSAVLYDVLGGNPAIWRLVERLYDGGVPISDFADAAHEYGVRATDLVFAISRAARRKDALGDADEPAEERLAPIRLHAFERAVPGVWSCVNPACKDRPADWVFGSVLPERADECPSCAAPVLEVLSCTDCGESFLEGIEIGPSLSAPLRNAPRDEFAFDSARESDDGTQESGEGPEGDEEPTADAPQSALGPARDRLFAANPTAAARAFWIDVRAGWRVVDAPVDGGLTIFCEDHEDPRACPHCHPTVRNGPPLLRPIRFGAPFLIGNAAPILLEGVDPEDAQTGTKLPSMGRRLLSFTDSRQGTARMAAKLQTESERNFVRSFIYHQVQASMAPPVGAGDEAQRLRAEIEQFEAAFRTTPLPIIEGEIIRRRRRLEELTSGNANGIEWPDLVNRLARRVEVSEWIKAVWQTRDQELFADEISIAQFLLLREFARRPRSANSAETLGIARLRNPTVDSLGDVALPRPFQRKGKTIADWRTFLNAVLTWFVRANGAIAISPRLQHWVSPKARLTSLVGPQGKTDGDRTLRGWPNGYFRANERSRAVAFLMQGLGLRLDDPGDRSDLDECLHAAWANIQHALSADPERRVFDFAKAWVAPVTVASCCPVTRRILDSAPFGLTPYGLQLGFDDARRRALPVEMPRHPAPILGPVDTNAARAAVRAWIETDPVIAELRGKGAWADISDRIALFADYARAAEHSAQQDSRRLRRYESEFKAGKINILNCSTTMEMGVDIGSVATVMMTNVPPSIANYRQRVGRAGRRGQAVALAFTFCKDRPLDRDAFRDPEAFLKRTVAAPKVMLGSRPIVQRHVNALLLGSFMRARAGDALKMQIGAFLGCPADFRQGRIAKPDRPVEAFIEWLDRPGTRTSHADAIVSLTRRSILEGNQRLIEETKLTISELTRSFVAEWEGLVALAKDEGLRDAGKSRMAVELRRLCEEFLLGGLADRGFLPGHGFPTDVVSFIPGKEFRAADDLADGARQFRTVGPQRSLDLAIRDYAPGSEVVLDGLVHKSAGVTLNWKRPASEQNLAEVQSLRHLWRCAQCGAVDIRRGGAPADCPACGAEHPAYEEFLRPAGFSVDPRNPAHADTDTLSYVPPADPVVAARGALWQSMPLPELGRFRCSREGLVYYSNRGGPAGFGFAVCLQCGRAEADGDNRAVSSPPAALLSHRPLRYRKDQEFCPGNDRPFSIKRNLSLGLEITTDVFELQPQQKLPRAAANALIIALREALAQELGVDADEMGFAVDQSHNGLGAKAVSLFLFDRATGGAGFAVSFEHLMRPVIRRAENILNCHTPGCEKACAACVLTLDAPDGKDELDRSAALTFVREHLTFPDDLNPEDQFSDNAELSIDPIDEIDRGLRDSARSTLTVFLPTGSSSPSLQDWPLASQFLHWAMRGHLVRLAFSPQQIGDMGPAEKLALRDFALQHKTDVSVADTPSFANGAYALAMISRNDGGTQIWATRDAEPRLPGPAWAQPVTTAVARGRASVDWAFSTVDLATLLPPPGAQFVQIGSELDGDLRTFGTRASGIIVELLKKCGGWPGGGILSARYQDPYVTSPLVARMLIDTMKLVSAMSGAAEPALVIETREPRAENGRGDPWQISHDWRDAAAQISVIELLGRQSGIRVAVRNKEVPHGRYLQVDFADGSAATIVLDQGFGAWGLPRQVTLRHDFRADVAEQARRLMSANVVLQRRGIGKTYAVATSART